MLMVKKISVIFGTRPEAIKLAPVILELRRRPQFECQVCVTAQHRQLLDQVLDVFDIVPDIDLNLMEPDQSLAGLTARAVDALNRYISDEKPDLVLVQGDTTTVFCAALSAFYNQVPVGHIEAGLRTGNFDSPWPEEANRVLTSHLASLHFAPTETNRQNLLREGIPPERVFVTGNPVIDALFIALDKIKVSSIEVPGIPSDVVSSWFDNPLVLITGHRRENFGPGLESICSAISELARKFPQVQFVYPVHLNPNVQRTVFAMLGNMGNVHLIEPLRYLPFISLMNRATLILTDSGGVQEEAPSLDKPVLVMRDATERIEAIEMGSAKLVGTGKERIIDTVSTLLTDERAYGVMAKSGNPYGDGKAARRILAACGEYLDIGKVNEGCT